MSGVQLSNGMKNVSGVVFVLNRERELKHFGWDEIRIFCESGERRLGLVGLSIILILPRRTNAKPFFISNIIIDRVS